MGRYLAVCTHMSMTKLHFLRTDTRFVTLFEFSMHIPEDMGSVGSVPMWNQKSENNANIWTEKPEPQDSRKFKNDYSHVNTSGLLFISFSAKNECHPLRTDGCQHFCHPGQDSYICSCAQGYKLGQDYKSCIPHGEFSTSEKWEKVVSPFPTLLVPIHTPTPPTITFEKPPLVHEMKSHYDATSPPYLHAEACLGPRSILANLQTQSRWFNFTCGPMSYPI